MDKKLLAKLVAGIFGTAPMLPQHPAYAASTDISSVPLANRRSSDVKPNVMLILDDSGSMQADFMPEAAGRTDPEGPGYRNYLCNTIFYNPNIANPTNVDTRLAPYYVPRDDTGGDINSTSPASFTSVYDNGYWSYDRIGVNAAGTAATRTNLSIEQGYGARYDELTDASPGYLSNRLTQPAYYWNYLGSDAASVNADSAVCKLANIPKYVGNFTSVTGVCSPGSAPFAGPFYTVTSPTTCTSGHTLVWSKAPVSATSSPIYTVADPFDERERYANWYSYYRTRMQMTKSAIGRAFLPLVGQRKYRIGFITIAPQQLYGGPASVDNPYPDSRGVSSSSVYSYNSSAPQESKFLDIRNFDTVDTTTNQPQRWFNILYAQNPNGATPLREGLSRVGRYYGGKGDGPNSGMIPSAAYDPVQYACQQNFSILTTDGYWDSPTGSIGGFKLNYTQAMDNQDGDLHETDAYGQGLPIGARPVYDGSLTSSSTTTDAWNEYGRITCPLWRQTDTQILKNTYQNLQSTQQALQGTNQYLQSTNQNLRSTFQNLQSTAQVRQTTTQNLQSTSQNLKSTAQNLQSTTQVNSSTVQNLQSTNQNLRSTTQNLQSTSQLMQIQVQTLVSSHREYQSTSQILQSTAQVSQTITQNLKSTNQNLKSTAQNLQSTAQVNRTTTQSLRNTNQNLQSTAQNLQSLSQIRLTTTQNLQGTSQNLQNTFQNLQNTTQAFTSTYQILRCNGVGAGCVPASSCSPVPEVTVCSSVTSGPTASASCTSTAASAGNSWITTSCATSTTTNVPVSTCTSVAASSGNSWVATTCATSATSNVPVASCASVSASAGNSWITTSCASSATSSVPVSSCSSTAASAGNNWVTTTCASSVTGPTGVSACSSVAASSGNSWVATTCSTSTAGPTGVSSCTSTAASSGNSWITTTCASSVTTNVPVGTCTSAAASSGNSWITTTCASSTTANVPVASCSSVSASSGNSWVTTTCATSTTAATPLASCSSVSASSGNSWVTTSCITSTTTSVPVSACTSAAASSGNSWITTTCASSVTTNAPAASCASTSASSGNSWITTTCASSVTTNVPVASCASVAASSGNSWVTTTCASSTTAATPMASCTSVAASSGNSWVTTACISSTTTNVPVSACTSAAASSGNSWVTTTCATSTTTNVAVPSCTSATASSGNSWVTTTCSTTNAGPTPVATCSTMVASSGNGWVTTSCQTTTLSSTPVSTCTSVAASSGNSWVTTVCSTVTTGPVGVATCTSAVASSGNSWIGTTCSSSVTTNVPVATCTSATGSSGNSWITTTCASSVTTNVPISSCTSVTASSGNSWVTTTCASSTTAATPVPSCTSVAASSGNSWVATTCVTSTTTNVPVATCASATASSGNSWINTTCASSITTNQPAPTCASTSASSGNSWITTTCASSVTTNVPINSCTSVSASSGNSWVTTTCATSTTAATPLASCSSVSASSGNSWVTTSCISSTTTSVPVSACSSAAASSGNSWITTTCASSVTTNVPFASCASVSASSGNSWVTTTCASSVTTSVPVASCTASVAASSGNSWVTTTCASSVTTNVPVASCTTAGASAGNSWVTTTCASSATTSVPVASCASTDASSGNSWVTTTCASSVTSNVPAASCASTAASGGNSWITTSCPAPVTTVTEPLQTCTPVAASSGNSWVTTTCVDRGDGRKRQYKTTSMNATQGLNGPTVVSSTAKLAYLDTWTNYWINQSTGIVSNTDGTTRLWSAATDPTIRTTGWNDWDTTCGPDVDVPAKPSNGRPLASYPSDPALDASCSTWPCTTVSSSPSGGSSNSLADVAAYYYKTDLRPSGTTGFNGADVSTNKVKSSGADPTESDLGKWQHMSTFTMGLGVSGTIPFNKEYYKKPLTTSPTSFQDIRCLDGSNNPKPDSNDCLNWPEPVPINKAYPVSDSRYDPNPGTRVDDLWHAAVNGRGRYFSAANPDDVLTGLQDALEAINAEGGAGTGNATSTQEPVSTNDWTFAASFRTVEWSGNIEARRLNTDVNSCEANATECTDKGGRLVGTTCGAGLTRVVCTFEGSTRVGGPIWVAQDKVDGQTKAACDDRSIYLLRMGATDNMVPFTWNTYSCGGTSNPVGLPSTGLNSTEQTYFTSTDSPNYSSPFPMRTWAQFLDMSPTQKTNAQGANLVNYLRGQTGMVNFAKGVAGKYFRNRAHALGDIVSSQPRYVRAPNAQFTDTGYALYKNKSGVVDRPAMLYVGANDGMLHAFRVGSDYTDPTGGTEAWAIVPSAVLPNLYKLGDTEYRSNHSFYVDGSPVIADVYDRHQTLPGICAGATVATTARDCWKTILVGGLGAGGKGYYALDITDPTAPKALWEFKHSSTCYDSSTPSTHYADCHLGYTYGVPMVTKLPDGTWVAMVGSGMNNVNSPTISGDGVGYLYVLDVITGEILHKISTGVGSAATTTTALSGTLTLNGTTQVTGSGTSFTTQLVSGQTIVVGGQQRIVQSVTDDSTLRVTVAFPASASGTYSGTAFSGTGSADFSHINAYVENYIQDNTARRVYGGDRLGNVWRIDLSNLTGSGGTADVAKLATLLDPSGNPQPITTTPQMMNVGAAQSHMVYVGTGRYLGESDLSDSQVQTIYALTDDLTITTSSSTYSANGGTVLPTAPLTLRNQLNQVVIHTLTAATDGVDDATKRKANTPVCSAEATAAGGCSGWYVDLPSTGERVNLPMRLVQGSLTANTNATVVGACDSGGNSWTNTFDAATGTAVAGSDGIISRYMAGAIAVGVTYIRSQSGRILAIITKSDSTQQVLEVPTQQASPLGRRTGWRDLLN